MGSYSIGEALNLLLEKSRWKPKVHELRLRSEWETIVGKTIAKYTRSIYIRDKSLTIYTDVAALKQELLLGKDQLIVRINEYFEEKSRYRDHYQIASMFSYWEQQSFSHYDHIIAGAGIVGLNVAIALKEQYPDARVLVLERGLLPTGASTRNAGFACMGSPTELLDNLIHMSEAEVIDLYAMRKRGLERLRNRLGDAAIGYKSNGSYELISHAEISALDKIDYLNELLRPVTGQPAFSIATDKIKTFGFSPEYTQALIACTCEGELHSGKLLRTLADYAMMHGIEIKTGADVMRFEEGGQNVTVTVKDPFRPEEWYLTCNTFIICTNAFTKQLLPDVDIIPGRGQVLVTEPIPGLKFKGIYHINKGFYYFREIDGRVLLGGGRNIDFEGEATTDFSLSEHIQADLDEKLRTIILPGTDFKVAQRWSGIMAFGSEKKPIVKAFSNRVYGAFRMSGMGVALAGEVAAQLADIVQSHI